MESAAANSDSDGTWEGKREEERGREKGEREERERSSWRWSEREICSEVEGRHSVESWKTVNSENSPSNFALLQMKI
uniref:Uncharacterized protein n=1 Tax=Nelumbo nucifera TaxID=4432 RepID=A0A822YTI5_NELNU|nr:TPA_asm: hypothetical protein HUJ06_011399 [Nelumbo nucifera]